MPLSPTPPKARFWALKKIIAVKNLHTLTDHDLLQLTNRMNESVICNQSPRSCIVLELFDYRLAV